MYVDTLRGFESEAAICSYSNSSTFAQASRRVVRVSWASCTKSRRRGLISTQWNTEVVTFINTNIRFPNFFPPTSSVEV